VNVRAERLDGGSERRPDRGGGAEEFGGALVVRSRQCDPADQLDGQCGADAVLEIALQLQRALGVALRPVEVAEMPAGDPADPQRVRVRPPFAALAAQA